MTQLKRGIQIELKTGKDDPEGSFKAVFSRFVDSKGKALIDHDGDVTLRKSFTKGQKVPIAGMGHNWDIPTIGFGVIEFDDEKAWADGQYNLKMVSGREHYESVKFAHENGVPQEYSYAYDVTAKGNPSEYPGSKRVLAGLDVKEISPVLLGAGIGTGTMDIKARGTKTVMGNSYPSSPNDQCPVCGDTVASHGVGILAVHKALFASRVKARKQRKAMSDEDKRSKIQSAVTDADKIEDILAGEDPGWSGPWIIETYPDYVIVQDDDDDGYLMIRYTINAAGEVALGDQTPVERSWSSKAADLSAMKYVEQAVQVRAHLEAFSSRSKSLADLRGKVGRSLSAANRERISETVISARAAVADLEELLKDADADVVANDPGKARVRAGLIEAKLAQVRLGMESHGVLSVN